MSATKGTFDAYTKTVLFHKSFFYFCFYFYEGMNLQYDTFIDYEVARQFKFNASLLRVIP